VGENGQKQQALLRHLPGVDSLLQEPQSEDLLLEFGRELAVDALRHALEEAREQLLAGKKDQTPSAAELINRARSELSKIVAHPLSRHQRYRRDHTHEPGARTFMRNGPGSR
jgi:hypothetical protein